MTGDRRDTGTGWPDATGRPGATGWPERTGHADRVRPTGPTPAGPPRDTAPPNDGSKDAGPAEPSLASAAERPAPGGEPSAAGSDRPAAGAERPAPTALRRLSGAGAMISVLLVLLGFTLVTQVRNTNTDSQLATARPEDLVRILSDLDAREERLRRELADLDESRRQLESGVQGREAALADARRRADALGILAGTLPAEGPGLEMTFSMREQRIRAESLLDAVQELRGAGAEAMQVTGGSGDPVRVVARTFFVDSGDGISVGGVQLSDPYTIQVIGDPQILKPALNIPGGVVESVRGRGGSVTIQQPEIVKVTALHRGAPLKNARPVS
jgi:uncharacterized protein YlxW (UPF0749 family)